jgi:hypothetical protein
MNIRKRRINRRILGNIALFIASLLVSNATTAQGSFVESVQVLGTVEVYCPTCALDMKFDEPDRMGDFELLFEEPGADFISCVRVPAGDLLCLDRSDKTLKTFPGASTTLDDVLSCEDSVLGLNTRKATTCTAYTFGLEAHFLAGQNNGKTFSLQRIFEEAGCASPLALTPGLCAEELYTGRPLLLDIKVVQDEVADNFLDYGPGVIGIEQRSDTAFYPVPAIADPILIASKKDWDLKGKQVLQSVDVLQISNPVSTDIDNYAVVTTSDDRILALKIGGSSGVIQAFDIASVARPAMQCNFDDQHYGLKVDEKTDFAIVTDRNWCQTFALQPVLDASSGELMSFELAQENVDDDLILSTGTYYPIGPTTSPGKSFDLRDCETDGSCTFITGAEGASAATLQDIVVASAESGVTVFQAKNVPFCPYKPLTCLELLDPWEPGPQPTREDALDQLVGLDVLYRVAGSLSSDYRPEVFIFNATPVLPKEILDRFDDSGMPPDGLPPLWMLPDFRAQIKNDFVFEALFFVTEARTDDVLTLTLEVAQLQGYPELGCESVGDLPPGFVADAAGLDRLLMWDVATRVSERDPTIDGLQSAPDDNYQGTIANADCDSTRVRGGGLSMFPYNLEASGCPGTLDINGNLVFDTAGGVTCVLDDSGDPTSEIPDDAVFAKAYVRYYDELRAHLQQLVCPILTPNDCASLDNNWLNGKDKLVKALDATIDPKTSAGAQNFGAVQAQLNNYQAQLAQAEGSAGPDPVNRLGEHAARVESLQHILNDKLAPSVPEDGFVESDRAWAE